MSLKKLSDINYSVNYDSEDNIDGDRFYILNNFYIPSLSVSKTYDRLAGFFSSSALTVAARGIADFIRHDGHMRLITCQRLSKEDVESISKGESQDEIIKQRLLDEIFKDGHLVNDSVEALGWMIANGYLEIHIVLMFEDGKIMDEDQIQIDETSIFHQKIGIFRDSFDNIVVFSGSINESAKAWISNGENIDVYWSWDNSVSKRIDKKINDFERYWKIGSLSRSVTISFPDAVSQKWIEYVPHDKLELKIMKSNLEEESLFKIPSSMKKLDYQESAVSRWVEQGYRGLFDMATGTGKTKTALLACKRLSDDLEGQLAIIVVCPFLHLTEMWENEFRQFGISNIIIGHSQSVNWKHDFKRAMLLYKRRKVPFVFITTINTYGSLFIQNQIELIGQNVLLVCDEEHHMGSQSYVKTLNERIPYRLGLSATIDRFNDIEGTNDLESYFGERCITYSLEDALLQGMLTPYYYYPVICYYTEEEYSRIISINSELDYLLSSNTDYNKKRIQELRISGYNLIAKMDDKIRKLTDIIRKNKDNYSMLIYCGATTVEHSLSEIDSETGDSEASERLISYIANTLYDSVKIDLKTFTYRDSLKQRESIIDDFINRKIQAIISIRCLDEGVNMPDIRKAFILSSSDDPKEYIQRRGRVLRKSNGKDYAEIYDFIAFPRSFESGIISNENKDVEFTLILRELRRLYEFGRLSLNYDDSLQIVDAIAEQYDKPQLRSSLNDFD